jgi:cardiolipin synthase
LPLGIACIFVICAGTVTADVLLKKSDVRSAVGWIAVAWLSPFVGALLYYFFGINRVSRRALKLERIDGPLGENSSFVAEPGGAANILSLARIGGRITGTPLVAGNDIAMLRGGETAYPEMLAAMRGGRSSIALASYIFRMDGVGREFVKALVDAHRRGVQVRVLVDSVGSGYVWSKVLRQLKAAGVPAARFLHTWIPWRMPFLNMRNHRKMLIVDGALCFMGGMNIGVEYTRGLAADGAVEDVHFKVEGPVVRQVMAAFARDWAFTTGENLERQAAWWPALQPNGKTFARGVPSGPDADIYKIEAILGAALTQAQKHVRIVTPYFLIEQRLQFAIMQAVLRGVRVDILVPRHGDSIFIDWAMQAHLRFFTYAAPNFYLGSPPFDHAKLITVDGEWCLIGSSNWDVRSLRLNFEFDLECYGADLTAALDEFIDAKLRQARKFGHDDEAKPAWVLLRNAATRLLLPYL